MSSRLDKDRTAAMLATLRKLNPLASFEQQTEQQVQEQSAADNALVLRAYLARIGYSDEVATALVTRKPNLADLQSLLTHQLHTVPFENLGQHLHQGEGVPEVAKEEPTLELSKALKKIVFDKRGGFCWELNFAFAWLLRSLGYSVRLVLANVVTPGGPVPGHLALIIDGLGEHAFLVDPGFGDAPRVPIPISLGESTSDSFLGDTYTLSKNEPSLFGQSAEQAKRFDMVLMRSRKIGIASSPMVDFAGMDTPPPTNEMTAAEPVHIFASTDDLMYECPEFVFGLGCVLADVPQNPFAAKRMVIQVTPSGFTFIGEGYSKTIENGVETSRTKLNDEREYRAAIEELAKIKL